MARLLFFFMGGKLTVFGSSSHGNCYLIEADGEMLMIEAGVDLSPVKEYLKWDFSALRGCFISHTHGDHASRLKDALFYGVPCFALPCVFEDRGLQGHPLSHPIKQLRGYKTGGFKVFTVPVVHDVPCLAFLVEHPAIGNLLFITDTMMLEYELPKVNHYLIEANYSDAILKLNIDNGVVPAAMKSRLMQSHMELDTTKGILLANDLSDVEDIVLIHLSDTNSDERAFVSEIESATGKPTYAAKRGFELNLEIH